MLLIKTLTILCLVTATAASRNATGFGAGDSTQSAKPRATSSTTDDASTGKAPARDEQAQFTTRSIRGRVVWLADVLRRRYGVQLTRDAQQRTLALETSDGQIHPLVEDLRGRSFRTDKRLRDMDVELLVRRYEGSPMIQIIRIHEVREDGKFIVDYWCDVCAIEMYEFGSCACCQDQNRLRKRRID